MSEMNCVMAKEGCDMEDKEDNWKKDIGWMNDDVRMSIDGRKNNNREYRKMRRLDGVNDEITERAKMSYLQRLQTTQPTSGGAVTADSSCCASCVEPPRPQQWGPDLPFLGMPVMRTRWLAGAVAHKSG